MPDHDIEMVHVKVLRPLAFKKKIIRCDGCGLDYPKREYKILFDNRKLVYFLLEKKPGTAFTFCHDCIFKIGSGIAKLKKLPEISIKVTDGKKSFYFRISGKLSND